MMGKGGTGKMRLMLDSNRLFLLNLHLIFSMQNDLRHKYRFWLGRDPESKPQIVDNKCCFAIESLLFDDWKFDSRLCQQVLGRRGNGTSKKCE